MFVLWVEGIVLVVSAALAYVVTGHDLFARKAVSAQRNSRSKTIVGLRQTGDINRLRSSFGQEDRVLSVHQRPSSWGDGCQVRNGF